MADSVPLFHSFVQGLANATKDGREARRGGTYHGALVRDRLYMFTDAVVLTNSTRNGDKPMYVDTFLRQVHSQQHRLRVHIQRHVATKHPLVRFACGVPVPCLPMPCPQGPTDRHKQLFRATVPISAYHRRLGKRRNRETCASQATWETLNTFSEVYRKNKAHNEQAKYTTLSADRITAFYQWENITKGFFADSLHAPNCIRLSSIVARDAAQTSSSTATLATEQIAIWSSTTGSIVLLET